MGEDMGISFNNIYLEGYYDEEYEEEEIMP